MAITNKIDQVNSRHTEVNTILESLTYGQIDNYINNNVTDLASAKEYLKKLSKVVLYIKKTKGK